MKTLVLYDGSCRMCVGVSGWLSRIDHWERFDFQPYQNEEVLARYPSITAADCEKKIHIITEKGKILRGADAMMEIWKKTGHWSAFLAYVFAVPPFIWLARLVYGIVAKVRRSVY